MLVKVWKKIVKIQGMLHWGEVKVIYKIVWVRWSNVCKPKKFRGFEIQDLRVVNLDIFGKWRWW